MQIAEAQTRVAEYHFTKNRLFSSATGRLIDALMRWHEDDDWCRRFPVYIDGMLFEYQCHEEDSFEGHGVSIIGPGQTVEPVSIRLSLDPSSKAMTGANIDFLAAHSTKPKVGSHHGEALRQSILARALDARAIVHFEWKHSFSLSDGAWSHDAPGKS